MKNNKILKHNFFKLAIKLNFTSINYNKLKLTSRLVFIKINISTFFEDIKYNDYFNAYRWNTTRGDSCCCC